MSEMITRQEFDAHRNQVSTDIAGLKDAIIAESEARQKDTRTILSEIGDIANLQGKPQFQAMSFYFGVFSFICFTVAGIYIWGQESRWTHSKEIVATKAQFEEATSIGRHQQQDVQILDMQRRLNVSEEWMLNHDHEVRGVNAAQTEQLKALERAVFGD